MQLHNFIVNIVMRRLTTGICSEKCVIRRFHPASVIECTHTNLDSVAYTHLGYMV